MVRYSIIKLLGSLLFTVAMVAAADPVVAPHALPDKAGGLGQMIQQWQSDLPDLSAVEQIDTLVRVADAYRALGRVRESLNALEDARVFAEELSDSNRLALILGGFSDAYLLSRQLDSALITAEQSVAAARKEAVPVVLGVALNHLGSALLAQQRTREALAAYGEGMLLAKADFDKTLLLTLQINALHAYLAEGNFIQGISTLEMALSDARRLPTSHEKAFDLIALGHSAQRIKKAVAVNETPLSQWAYEAFSNALRIAQSMDDDSAQSYALGHLGELYVDAGRFADAGQLFRRALFIAQQIDAPELLARWHWQRGRMLAMQSEVEAAEAAYYKALDNLATIQPALVFGQRGNPRFFQDNVGVIYRELADILLRKASEAQNERRRNQTLRKVREVIERYKTVELENYFLDDCVTQLREKTALSSLDSLMPEGTATLYPIVFSDRTVLLLNLPGGVVRQFDVPVSRAELRQSVADFRKKLKHLGNPRRVRSLGWTLYKWLIQPVEGHLKSQKIHTMVVVPDDVLRAVPFAAFFDGKNFLVSRYAFVVTPGLTLIDPEQFSELDHHVLLSGLTQAVQEFDSLPYVAQEIEGVASLYKSEKLTDEAFRKSDIEKALEHTPYSAILLATHGRFYGDPKQSFLLTYDDKIKLDELDRFVRISRFREDPVELLVLSACETAVGDERAALGLAGVAVKAGARSVMASLYAVNDASTAKLVPTFFKNLKDPSMSRAQALRRAQQNLLADAQFAHPHHWAAFILIGSWF